MELKEILNLMSYFKESTRYAQEATNQRVCLQPYNLYKEVKDGEEYLARKNGEEVSCLFSKILIQYKPESFTKDMNIVEHYLFVRTKENLVPFLTFFSNLSVCIFEGEDLIEMFDMESPIFLYKEVVAFNADEFGEAETYYDVLMRTSKLEE